MSVQLQSKPLGSSRFFKLSICFGTYWAIFTITLMWVIVQCRLCNGLEDCGTSWRTTEIFQSWFLWEWVTVSHRSSRWKLKLFLQKSGGFSWFTAAFASFSPRSDSSVSRLCETDMTERSWRATRHVWGTSQTRWPEFVPCTRHKVTLFKWATHVSHD